MLIAVHRLAYRIVRVKLPRLGDDLFAEGKPSGAAHPQSSQILRQDITRIEQDEGVIGTQCKKPAQLAEPPVRSGSDCRQDAWTNCARQVQETGMPQRPVANVAAEQFVGAFA